MRVGDCRLAACDILVENIESCRRDCRVDRHGRGTVDTVCCSCLCDRRDCVGQARDGPREIQVCRLADSLELDDTDATRRIVLIVPDCVQEQCTSLDINRHGVKLRLPVGQHDRHQRIGNEIRRIGEKRVRIERADDGAIRGVQQIQVSVREHQLRPGGRHIGAKLGVRVRSG